MPATPGIGAWRWIVLAAGRRHRPRRHPRHGPAGRGRGREPSAGARRRGGGARRGTAESSVAAVAGAGGLVDGRRRRRAGQLRHLRPRGRGHLAHRDPRLRAGDHGGRAGGLRGADRRSDPRPTRRRARAGRRSDPSTTPSEPSSPRPRPRGPCSGSTSWPTRRGARRARGARDTGRTVLTEPVRATSDGAVSFFLVKPLYRPGSPSRPSAERRGGARRLRHHGLRRRRPGRRRSRDSLPGREPVHASATATRSSPPPRRRRPGVSARVVDVGGRPWTVEVQDGRGVDRSLEWARRRVRHPAGGWARPVLPSGARPTTRPPDRSARVIGRTADVAQALAAAGHRRGGRRW